MVFSAERVRFAPCACWVSRERISPCVVSCTVTPAATKAPLFTSIFFARYWTSPLATVSPVWVTLSLVCNNTPPWRETIEPCCSTRVCERNAAFPCLVSILPLFSITFSALRSAWCVALIVPLLTIRPWLSIFTSPADAPICPALRTPRPWPLSTKWILSAYIPPNWLTSTL